MTNKKAKKKKAKKPRTNRVSAGSLTNKVGAGKAARKSQPTLTNAMVKAWGFECDDMVAAALKYKGNLIDRLKRSKALRDEWARGRFLRDISQFAAVGMTKAESATRLDIPLGEFEERLNDPEAADIWSRAQINTLVQLKTGLLESAMAGKGAAIKRFERILQEERPESALDICRVSIDQMTFIAGVTRQTLHNWVTLEGLSRNGDATFDLRVFVKWFEDFSQRKVNVTPKVAPKDGLRDYKELDKKMDVEERIGKLLPRDEVIKGLVARLRQFLTLWDRLVDGVCDKCANLPKQGVAEILQKFKDELRGEFCKVEIEMKLTDEQNKKLGDLLKELE